MSTNSASRRRLAVIVCAAVGLFGGLACALFADGDAVLGSLCGVLYGSVFALLALERAYSPGSGLILGSAYALLLWLAGPAGLLPHSADTTMCDFAVGQAHFRELVAYVLFYGIPLGLTLGSMGSHAELPDRHSRHSVWRALVVGGLGGLLASCVFTYFDAREVSGRAALGIVGIESALRSPPIGALVGACFGLLFQRDVRGLGSSLSSGLAYGMLWWFAGPLTLFPLLKREPLNWSIERASPQYTVLVGQVFFGLMLGLVYAAVDRLWVGFFYESDPLHRSREGTGTRLLLSLGFGAFAGCIGGLVYSLPMLDTGILPYVARIVGGNSASLGFAVHLAISTVLGTIYGALFAREATSVGSAFGWGLVYGLVWWFIGQLTLFPLWIDEPIDWSIGNAATSLPSLVGHLIYGGTTASAFAWLERRYARRISAETGLLAATRAGRVVPENPAPALCVFVLGLGLLLPILLG